MDSAFSRLDAVIKGLIADPGKLALVRSENHTVSAIESHERTVSHSPRLPKSSVSSTGASIAHGCSVVEPSAVNHGAASDVPFEITKCIVGHGRAAFGPDLGYENLRVTNPLRCRWTVSAHGNSVLELKLREPLNLIGFLNGTAAFCRSAQFIVNGESMGHCHAAHDATDAIQLAPGKHRLEVRARYGPDFCHAVWGFEPEAAFLEPPPHYVTLGAISRGDEAHLLQWIDHHLSLGVEHFYLLDSSYGKMLQKAVRKYSKESVVTVVPWNGVAEAPDAELYQFLTTQYAAQSRWMALLETNEFLVPKLGTSLATYFQAFEDYGALKISRRIFVADGREMFPNKASGNSGSESFFPDGQLKFIVQPRFVASVVSSHEMTMMPGRDAVGEYFNDGLSDLHLQVNHYSAGIASETQQELYWDRSIADLWQRQAAGLGEKSHSATNSVPVHGYIHVAAVGHWRSILNSQLKKCRDSGLWDRTAEIRLGIVGATGATLEELRDLPEKVKVLFFDPDLHKYEFPTLAALQAACNKDNLSYAWYIHSKGAVNKYKEQQGWRARMEEFVIIHHEVAISRLDAGYRTAAGFGGADHRWHIPGNFYWLRSDHALRLPKVAGLNWKDRWEAEKWIGAAGFNSLYFQDFGDTVLPHLKIVSSTVAAGVVSTCGYHGWEQIPNGANRIPVLVPSALPAFDHVISAHAPSQINIVLEKEATCAGFICASGRALAWTLEFVVNGTHVGTKQECSSSTAATVLSPGKHTLEIRAHGDICGAHSVWGIKY
jgi:hypothetical protein